MALCRDEVDMS